MNNITLLTAVVCALGWATHWFGSWGEKWKTEKLPLWAFVESNPPAFWFSVTATVSAYLIGPTILPAIGISFPAMDAVGIKLISSFTAGYMADSLVYKISNLSKKSDQ